MSVSVIVVYNQVEVYLSMQLWMICSEVRAVSQAMAILVLVNLLGEASSDLEHVKKNEIVVMGIVKKKKI